MDKAGVLARCGAVFAASWMGCADPSADVVITWVDGIDDGRGVRKMQVYESGERYALDIAPVVPGSGTEQLRIEVDSRGAGIAVSGEVSTRYNSLLTNREPRLARDAAGGEELAEAFRITRNGDALLRGFKAVIGQQALMPTSSVHAGTVSLLEPPFDTGSMVLLEASDAPVLFWVTQLGVPPTPAHTEGPLQALIYPSDHGGLLPTVDDVTVLAQGQIRGLGDDDGAMDQRVADGWCPGRACVSPDGRSLVVRGVAFCSFEWWRWEDADPTQPGAVLAPQTVVIEDTCPDLSEPWSLFAQVGYDTVVLDDDDRFYVVDLSTRTVTAGPKIWDTSGVVRLADRGRALVMISGDSRVTRIDADGVRLLSTEAHPCVGGSLPVRVSPSGYWVVRACNGDGTFVPMDQGTTLRMSPLGLEAFNGIPMLPLSVDDEGNAVLFSFDADEDPRGLFVLTSDGTVNRVDPLEPQPARITDSTGETTFFGFAAMRP